MRYQEIIRNLVFATKIVLLLALSLLSACTYNVVLEPHPAVESTASPISAEIVIPSQTANYTYDVTSATAGAANTFRIAVGQALVQYADAFLRPVFEEGDDVMIEITILGFDVHGFEAHINARFSVAKDEDIVFEKTYHANGNGYYARTFWGGAFAMKSSMRNTTREALTSLFDQFLNDAKFEYSNWSERDQAF